MRLPLATGKPVLGVADKSCLLTLASTQGGSVEGGCCALVGGQVVALQFAKAENLCAQALGSTLPSFSTISLSLFLVLGALETWATSLAKCRSAKWRLAAL